MAASSPAVSGARAVLFERYRASKVVPWILVQPVLAAVSEGATMGQAMLAGGMTSADLRVWEQLADEGHAVWVYVVQEMRRMRYAASRGATSRRKEIAEASDATMHETTEYLGRVLPDEYGAPAGQAGAAGERGGIVINILKEFTPAPTLPVVLDVAALPEGEDG